MLALTSIAASATTAAAAATIWIVKLDNTW